jgi:NAD(P)-dependent dehydrogenase (short-subunit alcohol dehydrogenase family)
VEALVQGAMAAYGRVDTWVNNAGVLLVSEFEKADLGEARRVFDVNFWGEYHGCKAVLPVMKRQGGGTIINISSVTAKRPLPMMSIYSASKAAINGLSEALRAELAETGVELCIVMPATIDTPLFEHARSKEGVAPKATPPIYPPSEVARAIEMCAVSPRRVVYAGPAGQMFVISNILAGGVLDRLLGAVRRPATLTNRPEAPRGEDNLQRPMHEVPPTTGGGWRTGRYKTFEIASRVALVVGALLVARRLAKRS